MFTDIPTVRVLSAEYRTGYGQPVTLECVVDSNPRHTDVTWFFVEKGNRKTRVEMDSSYSGSTVNNPSLTISKAKFDDKGYYECTAENVAGVGYSDTTNLIVTGSKL